MSNFVFSASNVGRAACFRLDGSSSVQTGFIESFGVMQAAIFTSISDTASENVQISRTLKRQTYLYGFGSKPVDITISGLLFDRNLCNMGSEFSSSSTSTQADGPKFSGWIEVGKLYNEHKVTARPNDNKTVKVLIGTDNANAIMGFLLSMNRGITDAGQRVGSFSMVIQTLGLP